MSSNGVVAVVGAGSMGRAILAGVVAAAGADVEVRVTTATHAGAARVALSSGVTIRDLESEPDANRIAVRGAALVVVAVKPSRVREVLAEVRDDLAPDAVVVSVAAGVSLATLARALPASVAVVRAMPNTPAAIAKGVTGLAGDERVTDAQWDLVRRVFESVGIVVMVDESRLDTLGTLSGSGPAYFYLVVEQMTRAACALGFSLEEASRLVTRTFVGAASLLEFTGATPAELRRQVTSPRGTTERAIAVLDDAHLDQLIVRACEAALARSRELAAEAEAEGGGRG